MLLGAALATAVACGSGPEPAGTTTSASSAVTTTSTSSTAVPSSMLPSSTAVGTSAAPSTTAAQSTVPSTAPATAPGTTAPGTTAPSVTTTVPTRPTTVLVHFLRDELLHVAARRVPAATPEAALQALLDGPTAAERAAGDVTVIPAGTRLLGVDLDGREAVVDLSGEFAEGGGSLSLVARVMQVVFTVTQFPGVEVVRFRLDGDPVVDLGGEGLFVDGLTRDRYDWVVPLVLLERPAPGAFVGRTIRVVAWASAAGTTLRVEVLDASGTRLVDRAIPAPAAPGEWGAVETVLPALPAGVGGRLTVRVSDPLADPSDPRAQPAEVVVTV